MPRALLPLLAAALAATGCFTPRFVSGIYWANPDTVYVAWSEGHGTGSRIRKCTRLPDNRLACGEQPEIDALLAK